MSIFKKELIFGWRYFQFNECKNFTIRRGIKQKYNIGDIIILSAKWDVMGRLRAKITDIQHIRFSDINDFTSWHMHNKAPYDKEKEGICDPFITMQKIYGENFNKNEIVTLIWFKVFP